MKKLLLVLTFLSFLFLLSCNEEAPVENTPNRTLDNISLQKQSFKNNNSFIVIANGNSLPSGLEKSLAKAGGTLTKDISKIGIAVAYSEDVNFISKASKIKGIKTVVPDYFVDWLGEPSENVAADFANPPTSGDDDFFFDLQWGHDAIDAPEAWDEGYRGAGVRVFVLDEGFDMDHPDLAPNINTDLSTSFVPGEPVDYLLGDTFSHGSHTAGTIAAADNAFGTIGVAPEAELVLVKVLSEVLGGGQFSWLIEALVYAADNDADVISMSLSGSFQKREGSEYAHLKNAVDRATTYAYHKGATVVAAAGNQGLDRDHTADLIVSPADGPNVISVSATAPIGWATDPLGINLDEFAQYSNFGQSAIDFAAPGGDLLYPGNESCVVAGLNRPCFVFDLVFSTGNGGWYWSAGTSMATPHVAGVAALIIGKNGGSMKPAQVEAILRASADDLGKPGNDDYYGAGRVNAYNAVK